MKPATIDFFDTTLRDGEQARDFNPTPAERAELAAALEAAGVAVIELASSEDSAESLAGSRAIARARRTATVCCLALLDEDHWRTARAFLDGAARSRVHFFLDRRRMSRVATAAPETGQILARITELVAAASGEVDEVEFSPQDATRFDVGTLSRVIGAALAGGADVISIADTVGTATPDQVRQVFRALQQEVPALAATRLSLHAHDHRGRAVDNVLAALACGVSQVEGTINGVGPSGGNTDLLAVLDRLAGATAYDLGGLDAARLRAVAASGAFAAPG